MYAMPESSSELEVVKREAARLGGVAAAHAAIELDRSAGEDQSRAFS